MNSDYTPPRPGTIRWLSANGHPGYSKATAQLAWERLQRFPHLSFSAAIRGGHELALAIEMERNPA